MIGIQELEKWESEHVLAVNQLTTLSHLRSKYLEQNRYFEAIVSGPPSFNFSSREFRKISGNAITGKNRIGFLCGSMAL